MKFAPDEPAYVGNAQIVPLPNGVAFIGGEAVVWKVGGREGLTIRRGAPVAPPLAGILWRRDGRFVPIPAPAGTRVFFAPLALPGQGGVAHVVWGTTSDTSRSRFDHADTIWYARFDGTRWTRPEIVTTAFHERLRWNGVSAALLATEDRLILAVPRDDHTGGDQLLLLFRTPNGTWARQQIPVGPLYEGLVRTKDGSLLLGYIAPAPLVPPPQGFAFDQNSVLAIRSADGGETWSKPDLVHRSGRGGAYDIQVMAMDSAVYLTWRQEPEDSSLSDSLLLALSTDQGKSWQRLPGLDIPKGIINMTAAGARAGRITIAGYSQMESAIFTGRWLAGRWIPGQNLRPAASRPALAALAPDSLVVAWGAPLAVEEQMIPMLMVSSSSACKGN